VAEILNEISTYELQRVLRRWIDRFEDAITAEGDYAS
jgi:hypothetical protein